MVIERTNPFDPNIIACTTREAARLTGRSHTRIKLAVRRGEIVARKDGGRTLIERSELVRWVAALPVIKPRGEPTARVAASVKERQHERGRAYAPSLKPRAAFDTIEGKQPRR